MADDLRAAIIRAVPTQRVEIVVGLSDREPGWIVRDRLNHERGPHLLRLLLGEQPLVPAGDLTASELRKQPPARVVRADRTTASGCGILGDGGILIGGTRGAAAHYRSSEAAVWQRGVRVAVVLGIGVGGLIHAKRPKHVVAKVLLPGFAAGLLYQLSGRHVEDVVV